MPSSRWLAALIPFLLLVPMTVGASASTGQRMLVIKPVRPYQPGDKVWYSTPPPSGGFGIDSTCERVPATGYISQGVFASSGSHFSSSWSWSGGSSSLPFTWYIKRPDESTADFGTSSGGGGNTMLGADTYHWKVQNNGGTPQAWTVCYS